jgi:hypothetical protein
MHQSGRRVGVAPQTDASKGYYSAARSPIPEVVRSNRSAFCVACVEDGQARRPHPSEER